MSERVLNENETVVAVPAHAVLGVPHAITAAGLTPYDALTSAVINTYASITAMSATVGRSGGNISCALLEDDFTRGPGERLLAELEGAGA